MFTKEQLVGKKGDYRSQSLFIETCGTNREHVIMTLKENDVEYKGRTLPSLRKMYMEDCDPTGYITAIRVFNSWDQWDRMARNNVIKKFINKFEAELDIMIRSGAVRALIDTAHNEGGKGTTAAKYIAEKGWDKRKAGAPSKEEKEKELKIQEHVTDEVQDDLERLGLH